jgi:hypothetical protein
LEEVLSVELMESWESSSWKLEILELVSGYDTSKHVLARSSNTRFLFEAGEEVEKSKNKQNQNIIFTCKICTCKDLATRKILIFLDPGVIRIREFY